MDHTSTPVVHPAAEQFLLPGSTVDPGSKVGVVIVHGYGGSIGDYRSFAEQLHQFGLTVLGVRLAGHGQGIEALRRATVTEWRASVADAVTSLRSQCSTIILVGSSFGAVLALGYAIDHPSSVNGIVTVNVALRYTGGGWFQDIFLSLLRLWRPDFPKPGLTADDRAQGQAVGSAESWPIDGIIQTKRYAGQEVTPRLGQLRVPVLIMASREDAIVGLSSSRRLYESLPQVPRRLWVIPASGHRPFRNSSAVTAMVKEIQGYISDILAKRQFL